MASIVSSACFKPDALHGDDTPRMRSSLRWLMGAACEAEVRVSCLLIGDTSNKPLEWTGHHRVPTAFYNRCLRLRGSIGRKS